MALSVLGLLVFAAWSPRVEPVRLRVLTYNIHHGEGADGRFDLGRTAALIAGTGADLVSLQEVDRGTTRAGGVDQLAVLEQLTGLRGVYGKAMDFQGGAYGVAILTRRPVRDAANRALPTTPEREPRTLLTVRVPLDGQTDLAFASTHLDQGRDASNRIVQAGHINEVLAASGDPTILAGDMNSRPDTEVIQVLEAQWNNPFPFPMPAAPPDPPRGLVDHVFVRPVGQWRPVGAQVVDDRMASDHRPLVVDLEWVPEQSNRKP